MNLRPLLILALVAVSLSACATGPAQFAVQKYAPSPDQSIMAVAILDQTGAPARQPEQQVYLAREPGDFEFRRLVFARACIADLALDWTEPRTLRIRYRAGPDAPRGDGVKLPYPWKSALTYEVKVVVEPRPSAGPTC